MPKIAQQRAAISICKDSTRPDSQIKTKKIKARLPAARAKSRFFTIIAVKVSGFFLIVSDCFKIKASFPYKLDLLYPLNLKKATENRDG
jgi:hypothetical protein